MPAPSTAFRPGPDPRRAHGRPKGTKDLIPRGHRAGIRAVLRELIAEQPETFRRALLRGLKSPPPHSARYLDLAALYLDGRPLQTVELQTRQPIILVPPGTPLPTAAVIAALTEAAELEVEAATDPTVEQTVVWPGRETEGPA